MERYLQRLRGSSIAKNTLWMLGGNGLKLVIQATYFILIARSLEPAQYGATRVVTRKCHSEPAIRHCRHHADC